MEENGDFVRPRPICENILQTLIWLLLTINTKSHIGCRMLSNPSIDEHGDLEIQRAAFIGICIIRQRDVWVIK